ncbi:MAG TPA: dethiobiotin synthase [Balneolales bacterium]|nr:dethiobiotin synthase [Balneolales bacterium]
MKVIPKLPDKFFVTGTDTGIGKTLVSAMLTIGLHADYWKPVQSGLDEGMTDTQRVKKWTRFDDSHFHKETYLLSEPLSPHASAAIDGVTIQMQNFHIPESRHEYLIVEGAGGLMVPLNDQDMIIGLIKMLKLPVLLVARSSLGTINHTLLSLEQLRRYDIRVLGVVLNGPDNPGNTEAIEKYGDVNVFGTVQALEEINKETIKNEFKRIFLA